MAVFPSLGTVFVGDAASPFAVRAYQWQERMQRALDGDNSDHETKSAVEVVAAKGEDDGDALIGPLLEVLEFRPAVFMFFCQCRASLCVCCRRPHAKSRLLAVVARRVQWLWFRQHLAVTRFASS